MAGRPRTKALLFIAIFLAINWLLSYVYTDIMMSSSVLVVVDREFYAGHSDLKTLVIGDSHPQTAVVPEILGDSFNFCSSGESYIQTYYKLKSIVETGARKFDTVLLPVDLHSFSSYRTDRINNSYYWVKYIDFLELGLYKGEVVSFLGKYMEGRFFPYAGKTEHLEQFFTGLMRGRTTIKKGFAMRSGDFTESRDMIAVARERAEFHLKDVDYYDEDLVYYLEKLLRLCLDNGIRVVLIKYPVTREYYVEAARLAPVEEINNNIDDIVDRHPEVLLLDYQDAYLDNAHLFYNPDHLNTRGATRFSEDLKSRLDEEF